MVCSVGSIQVPHMDKCDGTVGDMPILIVTSKSHKQWFERRFHITADYWKLFAFILQIRLPVRKEDSKDELRLTVLNFRRRARAT
jgi:hypothetical protein